MPFFLQGLHSRAGAIVGNSLEASDKPSRVRSTASFESTTQRARPLHRSHWHLHSPGQPGPRTAPSPSVDPPSGARDECPAQPAHRGGHLRGLRAEAPGLLISLQKRCLQSFQSHASVSISPGMAWLARTGLPLWRCTRTHGCTPYLSTMPPNWMRHPGEKSMNLVPGCIQC